MSDVYAVTEHQAPDALDDVSYELLNAGRSAADHLGTDLVAVVMGADTEAYLDDLGVADRVVAIEDDTLEEFNPLGYASAVETVVHEADPRLLLTSVTSIGMDISPRVARSTDRPLLSYVTDIDVDGDEVVASSQLYGGKMFVDSSIGGENAILAVARGAFEADGGREAGAPEVEELAVQPGGTGIEFVERHEPEAGDVDITREDRLLAVGRGIEDEENIPMAEDAATAMGAALASSRPLTDNGWLPKNRQVGKSGKTVQPDLYIAAGISGAPEHIEGMKDAGLIIAINTDEEAPIFDYADYGVVGDLFEVLPALEEQAD